MFVDDVNSTLRHNMAVEDVARYPTDSAYAEATSSALETIGPRIRSAGRLVVANVCCEDTSPGNWARSLRYVSDAMTEQFVKWQTATHLWIPTPGTGARAGGGPTSRWWRKRRGRTRSCSPTATRHPAISGDAIRPGVPAAGSRPARLFQFSSDYSMPTWFDEYETARALGQPRDARRALSTGVQMRTFENGLVLVNPTTETVRVDLDGPYTVSGVGPTTHVDMASRSGLLLRRTPFSALLGAVSEPLTPR